MNKRLVVWGFVSLLGCNREGAAGSGSTGGAANTAPPTTDDERTVYAIGLTVGERLREFRFNAREQALVQRGIMDKVNGTRPLVELDTFGPRIQQLLQARQAGVAQDNQRAGAQFAERAAAEPGAVRLPSGVVYRELQAGTGQQPTAADEVTVHYRGTLIDGTEFDSSRRHGRPATFPLGGVIPCWTEGVARMRVGGRAKLTCPANVAYGDRGRPSIPPGSTLSFEVELISVGAGTPPPQMPGLTFNVPTTQAGADAGAAANPAAAADGGAR